MAPIQIKLLIRVTMQHARFAQVQEGVLVGATQIASPNFNARPAGTDIQLIVIHNISLPPSQFGGGYIQQFFSEPAGLVAPSLFSDYSRDAGLGTPADFAHR